MDTRNPVTIQRLDYQSLAWTISHTRLHVTLEPEATRVHCNLTLQCQVEPADSRDVPVLRLDGVDLILESVTVDGVLLKADACQLDEQSLSLSNLPARCEVGITTLINPQANTALEGLYRSSGNYCTQCEAEGFRKITYYLDRPDCLSTFDVTIEADENECPVMLSNGNLVATEKLDGGRHRVNWHDPYPKPCYLFALVAGRLSVLERPFVTRSGRDVLLQIYVQSHNLPYCDFAMQALENAMRWDEEVYGFEYDLERFMIVAVDDFNMGAMENKGLNIFNSRFVLADRETATDDDFLGVESVIAHEYFHNWTGNRITCRDWFQLSLKEGLTVFRDQCFSSDMHSATVKRIEDVRLLRARQFAEDAGPMAHPIRPDSYIEINNFYTLTVYEKGAEVIRMLHTLLGPQLWRAGMDEFVQRHDGTATTCDAFIDAMQSVTTQDLSQFRLWYGIAGTPRLTVSENYDEAARCYSLTFTQTVPDTPGQSDKPALHIPVVMGLLDDQGRALPAQTGGARVVEESGSLILDVTARTQRFDFHDMDSAPTASLLRGFSAPVKLEQSLSDAQLARLIAHDADAFNRWEALQRLAERVIIAHLHDGQSGQSLAVLNEALGKLLTDRDLDAAFKAEALRLPSIDTLAESLAQVNYPALGSACDSIQQGIAVHHEKTLRELATEARNDTQLLFNDESIGKRRLANTALSLLGYLTDHDWPELAYRQFVSADNMTDRLAALTCLCHVDASQSADALRQQALEKFYGTTREHKLVLDKWFAVQALSRRESVIDDVLSLVGHEDFDLRNPNRVRALIGSFAQGNPVAFHSADGRGYRLLADKVIELDALNPQVAARLVNPLTRWRRVIESCQPLMHEQLQRILQRKRLSPDVYELVSKALE